MKMFWVWCWPGARRERLESQSTAQCWQRSSETSHHTNTNITITMSFLPALLLNTFIVLLGKPSAPSYLCLMSFQSSVIGEFKLSEGKEITRTFSDGHQTARTKRSPQQVPLTLFGFRFGTIYFQLKLCGNQLINMLSIICRIYHSNKGESLRLRQRSNTVIFSGSVRYSQDIEDLGSNSIRRRKRSLENYSIRWDLN